MNYSILAQPVDTLFFRDGSPFNAGEGSFIDSVFPPTPVTGYGFVRAALLETFCKELMRYIKSGCNGCLHASECEVKETVGHPSKRDGALRIQGPYLHNADERLFLSPMDLCVEYDAANNNIQTAHVPEGLVMTDLGPLRLPASPPKHNLIKKPDDFVISESTLQAYLSGQSIKLDDLKALRGTDSELAQNEKRVGIALDQSRTAKESYLYRIEMIRLNRGVGLWIGFTGDNRDLVFPDHLSALRMGGEGRRVVIRFAEGSSIPCPTEDTLDVSRNLKMVLLQHADFGGSWLPQGFEKIENNGTISWKGSLNGVGLTLVSALIGKPVYIGGWDTSKSRPRPMQALVPAGSVYYFKLDSNSAGEAINAIHDKNVGLRTNLGLGHSVIGVWSNE